MLYLKDLSKVVLCLCGLVASSWCPVVGAASLELPFLPPAHGYSRLLVTLRNAPDGTPYAGLPPAPAPIAGLHMAYEAALNKHQYILKLYANVPLPKAQAISKALLHDPTVLYASVLNEHDKVLYGAVSHVSATEAPGTPAFEFYVPRKGGRNAPLVLALTGPGGAGRLAFFLAGYAEQYGAVAAVMELPADEIGSAAAPGRPDPRTLAQKIAANDIALAAVVRYVGKLTGARTDKFNLFGTAAGALVAERYVFQHPQQILQAVFDVVHTGTTPVELAWPDAGQPYPAGISADTLPGANPAAFLKVPMQVLLPAGLPTTDANSGWATAMQQLAASDSIANTRFSSRIVRTDCPAAMPSDSATYCMRTGWYAEAIFDGLFSAVPAGATPIFLTMGPDTQMQLGHTITLTGVGGGNGWALFNGNSWALGDGSALPASARVTPGKGHATTLVFTPRRVGNYTFRLQAADAGKNQARAFINVLVTTPPRSPLPAARPAPGVWPGGTPVPGARPGIAPAPAHRPGAKQASLAIAGPSLVAPGQAFNLKAILPPGTTLHTVGCHWRQIAGPAARIVNLPKCQINYIAPGSPGLVNFQLQVTNQQNILLATATHLVQVTAKASVTGPLPGAPAGTPQPKAPLPARGQPPGRVPGLGALPPGITVGPPSDNFPGLAPGVVWGPPSAGYPPATTSGIPAAVQPPASGYGDLFTPNQKRRPGKHLGKKG